MTFPDPTYATCTIAPLSNFAKTFARPLEDIMIGAPTDLPTRASGVIGEHQVLSILGAAGLPVMPSRVADSVDAAVPVGLNLTSADAVRAAYGEIMANVAAANADRIESIDANPFLVREIGRGAMALDAVIITK